MMQRNHHTLPTLSGHCPGKQQKATAALNQLHRAEQTLAAEEVLALSLSLSLSLVAMALQASKHTKFQRHTAGTRRWSGWRCKLRPSRPCAKPFATSVRFPIALPPWGFVRSLRSDPDRCGSLDLCRPFS